MPGYSLWLVPLASSPFTTTMQELISDTVPSNFTSALSGKKITFSPHVTLTSDIDPSSSSSPQAWLDALQLPTDFKKEHNECILELDEIQAGAPFFRKLTIRLNKLPNLVKLAAACRQQVVDDKDKAQQWAENEYGPHMSLLYADLPEKEVAAKVPLVEMQLAYAIGDLFACCGGALCMGGELVLVDTRKAGEGKEDVEGWEVVARKEVDWCVWRMTRNLI